MNATEEIKDQAKKASDKNGVIKIFLPKRGRIQFQFNEDDAPFTVDVIEIYDGWNETNWKHRDEKGTLPRENWGENSKDQHEYVQAVINDAYAKMPDAATPTISRGESEAFIAHLLQEVKKLRDFFSPKDETPSSSAESSAPEQRLNFSQ